MLSRLNRLKSWQAALIISVVGFAVYLTGLNNDFQIDDISQIVQNVPVHSISNIKQFFEGGTFYNGGGAEPLIGAYYRPLMTTVFSLSYTLFGANPFPLHLIQLILFIGGAIMFYLFLSYPLKRSLALFLALIFLVHPLNSETAYYIAAMQDALSFFFGMTALWLLARLKSVKSLGFVVICLSLGLLSKEVTLLFVFLAALYLFWWNRKRLLPFIGLMTLPIIIWFLARLHAIGLNTNPMSAPIDTVGLAGRLLNDPSLVMFYISKTLFPWRLSTGYFWVHDSFSVRYFVLPLIIEIAIVGLAIWLGVKIKKQASKSMFYLYLFFAIWTVIGFVPILQIVPIDMTVCELWFRFSMAGVLGMVGVVLSTFHLPKSVDRRILIILACVLIAVLGIRTSLRGLDWSSDFRLAKADIVASPENYTAYNNLAVHYGNIGEHSLANGYAKKSAQIYPIAGNVTNLGLTYSNLRDYPNAYITYIKGLKYQDTQALYDNIAELTLSQGSYDQNKQILQNGLNKYPQDSTLWQFLAILEYGQGNKELAKTAIINSAQYGQPPYFIYYGITTGQTITINGVKYPTNNDK